MALRRPVSPQRPITRGARRQIRRHFANVCGTVLSLCTTWVLTSTALARTALLWCMTRPVQSGDACHSCSGDQSSHLMCWASRRDMTTYPRRDWGTRYSLQTGLQKGSNGRNGEGVRLRETETDELNTHPVLQALGCHCVHVHPVFLVCRINGCNDAVHDNVACRTLENLRAGSMCACKRWKYERAGGQGKTSHGSNTLTQECAALLVAA